tara:strand:- start:311 stop:457 length:147 start_codon:yes stop_codon:yes gene_type:complete
VSFVEGMLGCMFAPFMLCCMGIAVAIPIVYYIPERKIVHFVSCDSNEI